MSDDEGDVDRRRRKNEDNAEAQRVRSYAERDATLEMKKRGTVCRAPTKENSGCELRADGG